MSVTSRTGLIEGIRRKVKKADVNSLKVDFPNVVSPAPYVLRPFAGVYNPYPYGCSVLCNHPADYEAKDIVKRAKDTWASEGKALLLSEELSAIRAGLLQGSYPLAYDDGEDAVPEELFRRYTETDSRPLTPAPTLASIMTRGSGRRCVTPDPFPCYGLNPARERTMLVLDLRRSHSQDTLSWHGVNISPTTVVQHPSRSNSPSISQPIRKKKTTIKKKTVPPSTSALSVPNKTGEDSETDKDASRKLQQQVLSSVKSLTVPDMTETTGGDGDEEIMRRRGKNRKKGKKSGRDHSRGPEREFQGIPDPGETQVSTVGPDSQEQSARPSLIPPSARESISAEVQTGTERPSQCSIPPSFIDEAILIKLQRELDQEIIDSEFNIKKHKALEEAFKYKITQCRPVISEEMRLLKRELCLPESKTEMWLSMPRSFSRQSVRFSLPLDIRTLSTMSPMQYIQKHVWISSGRRLLYNNVFNRHREDFDDDDSNRRISGRKIPEALCEIIGQSLSEEQMDYFHELLGWSDTDLLDFQTWAGVCALCERILGPQFPSQIQSKSIDPCQEVERADFEMLPHRLQNLNIDPRLKTILLSIREL